MSRIDYLVFAVYPYVCVTVFVLGMWTRLRRDKHTLHASSSQLMRKGGFGWASNTFHVGVIGVAAGHVAGLLLPTAAVVGIGPGTHQMMELVVGGFFGSMAFVGLTALIYRRTADVRVRRTSERGHLATGAILWLTLVVGLSTLPPSWQTRREGAHLHSLASWAQHVVTFRAGAADLVIAVPWIYKLHVFMGLTVALLSPFTRLVHACRAPLGYVLRRRHQIVRARVPAHRRERALPGGSVK